MNNTDTYIKIKLTSGKHRFLVLYFSIALLFLITPKSIFAQVVNNYYLCTNNSLNINYGNNRCGFWRTIQGYGEFVDSTSHANPRINNLGFGTNVFYFYEYRNCGNRSNGFDLEHIINAYVYASDAGRDTTICYSTTSFQLSGTNPASVPGVTGTWTVVSGTGTFANSNLYNTTVTNLTVGTINKYQWRLTGVPTNPNGCVGGATSDIVNITVISQPNAYAGVDQTICPGNSATLTASAGAGYSYLWSTGQATQSISVTPAVSTNYTLTVTDAYNCTADDDVDVFLNNLNTFNLSSNATSYCTGGTGVTISLSGSEIGVNYQLKRGVANDGAAVAGTGGILTWVNKTAGTYTVVATNPATSCSKTMNGSIIVTANPVPTVFNLSASSPTYCSHTSGVTLSLSGSENGANFEYQLFKTGLPDGAPLNGTGGVLTWTNKTAGNYSVITTNTLTGCSNSMTGNPAISSITSPSIFNVSGNGSYCENTGGLPVALDGSEAGMNYQLLKDGLPSGASKAGTGGILTWNNNLGGNYTIQATNAGLTCNRLMNGSASITEIPIPTVYNVTAPSGFCTGEAGVTVSVSGSQIGVDYILSKDGIPFGTIAGTGGPLTWSNMTEGTYSVQAKTNISISCAVNMAGSPVVTAYPLPMANAGMDQTICQGEGIQLNATGGNAYNWSPSTGLSNASIQNPIAKPLSTINYTVIVTDANGCSASDQVQVTVRANPDAVTSPTVSVCNGQTANLTATDNIPGNNETYLWNTGETNDTIRVSPSTNTRYYVTVTDVFGCHDTASVLVNIYQNPGVNAGSDTKVCYGSSVTLAASGNADLWEWNTGANTPSITFTPSITANYTLKGTFLATGCYTIDTVRVTVNSLPVVSFTLNGGTATQYCSNGALVALAGSPAGGGFTSSAPGAISGNSFDPKVAGVGSYTISYLYTDANLCSNTTAKTVNIVAPPTVTITGLNASYCNSATDQIITGNPLQDGNGNFGTWTFSGDPAALVNNGDGTATFKPSVLTSSGIYTITYQVNNFAGCTGTTSRNVTINWVPTANFVGLPANICQNALSITLTGNQGAAGTFSGSGITDNGNGTATFNPNSLAPANYNISFTYQDPVTLCQSISAKTITVKPLPGIYAVTGGGSYCEGGAGVAIGLTNSTIGVNYELFLDGVTTGQIEPGTGAALNFGNKTLAGVYTAKATTVATSCTVDMTGSATITINPLPLDAQIITGVASVCPGSSENYSIPAIPNATTYNWTLPANASISSGAGTNAITVLFAPNAAPGNITVRGQNACGNGGIAVLPVTIKPLPAAAGIITGSTLVCQNEKNVIYSVGAIANATGYTWTIPSGATITSGLGTTQIIVDYDASANSGNVTVRGNNGCGSGTVSSITITVTAAPQLTLNAPSGQITCSVPTVTVSASSSTAGATFLWTAINGGNITAGAGTPSATANATGDYIITVQEPVNSCITRDTVTVVANLAAPQNINIVSTNAGIITCSTTQVTLTASTTSVYPVGYLWIASAGGNIVSGANTATPVVDKAGTYEVAVTNLATGCATVKSIAITEQKVLPNISVVDPEPKKLSCTVSSVTLSGSSSTSGVTYTWSGPAISSGGNTQTPVVTATGTYTLTVTAPNGCTAVATVQVAADNSLPNVTVNTNPANLTCTATSVTLNGLSTTAGASLLWTGPGIVSGNTTQTPVVNQPGIYILTATHPITGCTDSKTVAVLQNTTNPTVTFPVLPATITCTTANVTIQGATSATNKIYQWSTANGNIVSGANTPNVVASKAGTYTLTVTDTDNGCQGSNSIAVNANIAAPDAQIAAPTAISCTSPSVTLAGSSATTPVNVAWTTADGTITSGATSFTPVVSKGGTYVMTVTNTTNGCTANASILVPENLGKPVISIDKTPPEINCFTTQVQLSGTAANSTLLWTGPAGATITNNTSSTPTINMAGRYYLTATGTNGCTSKDSTDVTGNYLKPLNVQIAAPGTLTCTNSTLQLTGSTTTASAMYQWSVSNGGNIISATNANTVTINTAGDYKMIAIHPTSFCRDSATVTVAQNISAPAITFPSVPATITCSVTNSQLNANVTPAGSALLWTGPGTISDPTIANPIVNAAGTYTLQATHPITGCITTAILVVPVNKTLPDISIAAPPAITCTAPSVSLDATTSVINYTAAWTTTNGTFSGPTNLIDAVATSAGLYTLTLTNNNNGCSASSNVLVTANNANPDITVDPNPAKLTCAVTQVELYGTSTTAGTTLAWTGPGNITDPNTQRPKVDAIGVYTLTVTGTNGCQSVSTVNVSEDKTNPGVPNILTPADLTCSVTATNLEVSPLLANVDYAWTTAGSGTITNGTTAIATVNAIGTYTVQVTDRTSGCTSLNSVTVSENKTLPTAAITGTPYLLSCTQNTLQLNGNTSTGINPVWTATAGGHIVSGTNTFLPTIDATGDYILTVAHPTSGCTHSTTVTVTKSADLPSLTVDAFPPALDCATTQVTLSGQPTEGGTTFTWTASPGNIVSGETTYNPVVDQPGTYILRVTKTATGCVSTASIQVVQNTTLPQIAISAPDQLTCSRTQVQLNASSPLINVSYAWSTSGTGSIKPGDEIVNNPIVYTPATYTVTLTDLTNQCTSVRNVVVTEDISAPNINVNKTPAQLTCSVKQVTLSGNSLTPNATYLWTGPGSISNPASKTPAVDAIGTYTLQVTNPANGCSITDNVAVTSDVTAPDIWVDTNPNVLNCVNATVQIKGNSATPNVTYLWSGPGNISNATLKEPFVDAPGTYQLTVTSAINGCTSTFPVTVSRNVALPTVPLSSNAFTCVGSPAATLTATGNNIQWYNNPILGIANRVQTGATFTPSTITAVGDYYFYATQTDPVSQCEGPAIQVTYSVKALPSTPVNVDNAICEGLPNPVLQANGTNIKWYDTPGGTLLASGTQYTPPASVNTAGSYTYFATQTDALGCESTGKAVSLTIHPIPAMPTVDQLAASVCYGTTNTTFNASGTNLKWYASATLPAPIETGSTFKSLETNAGSYSYYVTQTSAYGCVSPYETVAFTIQPLPQKFTVTGGGVYCADLNGVTIGLSGSQLNTAYQLLLNGTTVITSMNGTGNPLDFGLQKVAGNYTINAINNNTCSTTMTGGVSIIANPLPGAAGVITGLTNVCEGATNVTYSIAPIANASTYVWIVPAGATISSGLNSNTITIDYGAAATSGNVNVYAQNSCGTGAISANLPVIVTKLPVTATNIKFIGNNNAICLGDTGVIYEVDLIANATTYEWVLPAGAIIMSGVDTRQIKVRFASNAAQGTQLIRVRGRNACGYGAYSAPYTITVNPNPTVYAGIDQNICAGQTALQGSAIPAGGSGVWDLVSGSVLITNNTLNSSSITSVAQGENILTWTITENGCKARDTVKIFNNQLFVDAGQNLPICSSDVILQGSALPAGTSGIWSVASGSAAFVTASQPNTRAYNFGYGDTKLYWTVTKNGCNSKDSVIITNYRPSTPDAGGDQIICTDNTWLSATHPIYGTGQWFLYSGSGTIANPTQRNTQLTSVAVGKNVLVWVVTNQICSRADTIVIWNNSNTVNAGYDQTLCDNRATLEASIPPTGATGQWSVLSGSASFLDSKVYNTKVSGLNNGTNMLIWSITKTSCTNTDTVTLISNMPTAANAGPDQEIPSSSTNLDGNMPVIGTGKWTVLSGAATFANDALFNTSASALNPGINIFRWTITYNGCTTFDDVTITNGTLETIDAGQNQTLCTSETQLEASRPLYGFGKWSVQKGSARFDNNEQYNTRVFDLLPGENILRWSVSLSGVEFYDTVIIANNKPTLALVGPKQTLCKDSSLLTGNMAINGTGKWTLEGGAALIADPLSPTSKVTKLGNGDNTFRWTIINGSCVSSAQLIITNDIPTTAYAGLDQTLCTNSTLLQSNSPSIGTGEWSVMQGAGSFNQNEVSGLAPGNNILRWTIRQNNCSSYDDVIIISHKPTTASAGNNTIVCTDSIILSANKPNTSLGEFARWTVMNGSGNIVDTTLNNSWVKRLAQGNNVLRWTINNNGCISYDDVEINFAFVKADAGTDVVTCDNHLILNANNPSVGTGEWSIIGGSGTALFVNPNSPNSEVRNLDQGTNILRWTIRNYSCISTDEVNILNNAPSVAFAGGDQSLCTNTTILAARSPLIGKGAWSVLSGAGHFSDTSAYNATVNTIGLGVNTYRWTVTNTNCTSADEVVISNNMPISTFAGVDQTLCSDSAYLTANQPVVGTGVWSIIRGAGVIKDVYNAITSIKALAPDTNLIRWTVTNKQCVDYREIKIINNYPTIANAGADRTICSDMMVMDGNVPVQGIGEWSVISGAGNFTAKNQYNTLTQGLLLGNNVYRWKITKQNCLSYDDVVILNDNPTTPDAGTTVSVCDNTASLNGNKPTIGIGYWSVLSGQATFIDSTKYNTRVVALGQGSNFLLWTTKHNRCTLSDVVEVRNNLTNVYAGPDQILYADRTMLVGNEPPRGIGTWSLNAGAGSIDSPNSFESGVSGLGEGLNTFNWSVDIDGCISTDQVQITYYKLPTASFAVSSADGCPPHEVRFTKTSIDKYAYSWDFGDAGAVSTDENPVHTYASPGIYAAKLTVIGPDGKPVTRERTITVHELPEISFDIIPQNLYIPDEELRCYNYTKGGQSYVWNFGDGNTSTDFNPIHQYADTGYYDITLRVTTANQCTDSLVVINGVHVIETSNIKFPTAFTPNPSGSSDGHYNRNDYNNDVFYPIVLMGGIENYKMQIFNRWGVLIFESDNIDIGWNGYYKGKLLMEDVYIYRVTGTNNNGKKLNITGDVLLMHR